MAKETMPNPCLFNPCLNIVVTSFNFRHSKGSEKSEEPRAALKPDKHNHILNCFPIPTQKSSLTKWKVTAKATTTQQ